VSTNDFIDDLLNLMTRLRDPETGCPWDLKQTYQTIVSSTLEEAYEVVDAIERKDYEQLKDELGDLLFQVVFYSQLGKEEGRFDFQQIVKDVTQKLLRRHPHVFPDGTLDSRRKSENQDLDHEANIKQSWERLKQEERQQKGKKSLLDDIPKTLPATSRSVKLQKRAASVGFDWPSINGVYEKIQEELGELQRASSFDDQHKVEEELGDLLFTVINLSRHLSVEPEKALRLANYKFEQRLRYMEGQANFLSQPLSKQPLTVLEEWWQEAKNASNSKK